MGSTCLWLGLRLSDERHGDLDDRIRVPKPYLSSIPREGGPLGSSRDYGTTKRLKCYLLYYLLGFTVVLSYGYRQCQRRPKTWLNVGLDAFIRADKVEQVVPEVDELEVPKGFRV